MACVYSRQDLYSWKELGLGSSGSILTPPWGERYKVSLKATVQNKMPSDNWLLNLPIPLPLALYFIPLEFMAEYIAQQLWAFVHQSFEEVEDLLPSSSSPSSPPSSSPEENWPVTSYETLPSSLAPVLLTRLRSVILVERNLPRTLSTIPENPSGRPLHPILLCCLLCWSLEHELLACPQCRCPICLHATPRHGNHSCPNSHIHPDTSDEDWSVDLRITWSGVSRAEVGVILWYWQTPILFPSTCDPKH